MQNFNGKCPACGSGMLVGLYRCPACEVEVKGSFTAGALAGLRPEQVEFVKTFLQCRGNIKEVEREMGISYPTVRNRLDAIIKSLGLTPAGEPEARQEERANVLDQLEKGEIDAEEAAKLLSGKRAKK